MRRPRQTFSLGFRILTGIMGWVLPWILRAWFWTIRVTVLHPEIDRDVRKRHVIGTLWHQNFIFYAWYYERRRYLVMSSWSRDGEIMVRVMRQMGYRHVRGSSSKGGAQALYRLVELARHGATCAMVADGPRGPARVAKVGVVLAASHTGLPVVPAGAYSVKSKLLRNWDRTAIPWPFSRVILAYGAPIRVPPDLDHAQVEAWRIRIEGEVTRAEDEAEAYGRRLR